MQINNWNDAEDYFEKKVAEQGKDAFLYKITDTKSVNRGRKINKVIAKKTPADYIVTCGDTFYAEVKYCSNAKAFPFSYLTQGQLVYMRKQIVAGGKYNVYIYNSVEKVWYTATGLQIIDKMDFENKKSIPYTELTKLEWN